ncbi:hypothetical protein WMF31_12955 [Sorangium sp. So ce1036]|uniref:hypothetical protein n=1 Tax=Sorangium sp. So ce1036 TaxID=3133328 RepID=UPI003F12120F
MWLEAIITREDLAQVLGELLPVKIHLDDDEKTDRWLYLDRATAITLVEDMGLRVSCPAELKWSIAGVTPTIKLDELTVLISPEIIEKNKGSVLGFNLELEAADIRGIPAIIDNTVVKAVNSALASKKLEWNFTKTLTHTVGLPSHLEPIEGLHIGVAWGKRRIGQEALALVVSFKLSFVRND